MPTWENWVLFALYASPSLKRPVLIFDQTIQTLQVKISCSYLQTTRWRCAEAVQGASGHGYYDTLHVWSEYAKALQRYSLTSSLTSSSSNSFMRYSKTVWLINLNFMFFCRHDLKMSWFDFRENCKVWEESYVICF